MSTNQQLVLSQAKANILQYCVGVELSEVSTALYDFVVEDKQQGLRFGVHAVPEDFGKSVAFNDYVATLQAADLYERQNCLPIVIVAVNTSTLKTYLGVVVSWNREHPRIYKRVSMREATYRNWGIALDFILSMNDAISVLSQYGINILKRISVEVEGEQGEPCFGEILYMRSFTDTYRMRRKEVVTEKEKFERLLYGIPEDEYPSDKWDELIASAISQVMTIHPQNGNNIKSESFLFTTDLKSLQVYKNYAHKRIGIVFSPQDGDVAAFDGAMLPTVDLQIYSVNPKDLAAFPCGYITMQVDVNELKTMIDAISDFKKTFHQISDYIM